MSDTKGIKVRGTELRSLGDVDNVTCYVKRDSLKAAPWNPPIRTQLQYLAELRDSMATNGFFPFQPIIVAKDGTIVDGHRRWTCADLLGLEDVPVVIVDMDADELWALLNGTGMTLSGAQVLQAKARGLKAVPPKLRKLIGELEEIVGKDGMDELGNMNKSPFVLRQAKRIALYTGNQDNAAFIRQAIFWLAKHPRMNIISSQAMKALISGAVIEAAIFKNTPLKLSFNA